MYRYLHIFLYRYPLPTQFCQNIIFFIVLVLLSKINWANMSIHDSVPLLHKFLCACVVSPFCRVWLFATPWTVACQSPCPWGFSRQEYWSGLHALFQGIFPTQGLNPSLLCLLHWWVGSLLLVPPGNYVNMRHGMNWLGSCPFTSMGLRSGLVVVVSLVNFNLLGAYYLPDTVLSI